MIKGRALATIGRREQPIPAAELFAAVTELVGREPLVFDAGPERVASIGLRLGRRGIGGSRGGGARARRLPDRGAGRACDGGRPRGRAPLHRRRALRDRDVGIRRLGELVAERFGVEHEFIDVPNPV